MSMFSTAWRSPCLALGIALTSLLWVSKAQAAPAGASALAPAGSSARRLEPSVPIIPLSEVRPGMTGYGLTVFSGTVPERFPVRVVGVDGVVLEVEPTAEGPLEP